MNNHLFQLNGRDARYINVLNGNTTVASATKQSILKMRENLQRCAFLATMLAGLALFITRVESKKMFSNQTARDASRFRLVNILRSNFIFVHFFSLIN